MLFEGNDFFKQHANYLQVNIIGTNEDEYRSWFGFCEARLRLLIGGLESPTAGVRAYPFAKFFHWRGEDDNKYVASFFIALRFADTAKRVDLGPLVKDYLQLVNDWEGRGEGMDMTVHLVAKQNLPSFVFATCEEKGVSDAVRNVAVEEPPQHVPVKETDDNDTVHNVDVEEQPQNAPGDTVNNINVEEQPQNGPTKKKKNRRKRKERKRKLSEVEVSGDNAREQGEIPLPSTSKTKNKENKKTKESEAEVSEENARKQLEDEAMQELCRKGYYNIS